MNVESLSLPNSSHSTSAPQKRVVSPGLWAAALCFFLLLPCLWFPLGKDASVFLQGGRVVVGGGMLYRDLWDIKPPLIYLLAAIPASLPAAWQVMGFYLLAILASAATMFFLTEVATPIAGKRVGLVSAPLLAITILYPATTSLGQCESWSSLLGWAAIWCWINHKSKWSALGAGLLLGAIPFLKVTSLLPLVPFFFLSQRPLKHWAVIGAGFVGTVLLGVGGMRVSGVMPFYEDIVHNYMAFYVSLSVGKIAWLPVFIVWIMQWAVAVAILAVFCLVGIIDRTVWRASWKRALLLSFALGLLTIWLQHRNFVYQWTVFLPTFALLSATGMVAMGNVIKGEKAKVAVLAAAVVLCLGSTRDLWIDFVLRPDATARDQTLGNRTDGAETWAEQREIKAYLNTHSQSNDLLWVWGFEPTLYLASPRPTNRFIYTAALAAPFAPTKWKEEAWDSLRAKKPRFIVIQSNYKMTALNTPDRDVAELWRETPVFPWFVENYELEKKVGDYKIYSLKTH